MIKIEKDGHFIICSNNSYDTMYKRLGYKIVGENKTKEIKQQEKQKVEIDEIPVIEMKENKKNVKETLKTSSKEKTITKTKNNKSK